MNNNIPQTITVKYLLLLSTSNILQITAELRENIIKNINNQKLFFIRKIILAIFVYNEEKDFNKKINIFETEFNELKLEQYLKINFLEIKNLLEIINNINKDNFNDYYLLYNNCNNIKNKVLIYSYLYFILNLMDRQENFIYKDKTFTLQLIKEIEENKDEKNEELEQFFLFIFYTIFSSLL